MALSATPVLTSAAMRTALKTLIVIALLLPAVASAQQYQPWNNPDSGGGAAGVDRLQGFVERLNSLIDEAERSRAADPGFLSDLRRLSDEYRRGPRTLLLSDDFGDGDYTRNPRWTVTAGRYWVEQGWGLRSAIKPGQTQTQTQQKRLSGKDAAAAIFGQILQQAIDPEGRLSGDQTMGGSAISATAIQTGVRLANAFALEMDFSSWQTQGQTQATGAARLEVGPYQGMPGGAGRAPGYVLAYRPGGGIELFRVTSRGSAVIDSAPGPLNLEDKKTHRLEWTRSADGRMRVAIDGREILAATDLSFRDDFDGLRMVNRGGDYIVKRIVVYGSQ